MGLGYDPLLPGGGSLFYGWTGRLLKVSGIVLVAARAGRKEVRRPDGPGVRHRRHVAGRADRGRPKAAGQLPAVGLSCQAGDDPPRLSAAKAGGRRRPNQI